MQYSLTYSRTVLETAKLRIDEGVDTGDKACIVCYLSLMSSEIPLKAVLENLEYPLNKIRAFSHDVIKLFNEVSNLEVYEEMHPGKLEWRKATSIRAQDVDCETYGNGTLGTILGGGLTGLSKFPAEYRYGEVLHDIDFNLRYKSAVVLLDWVEGNWNDFRKAQSA